MAAMPVPSLPIPLCCLSGTRAWACAFRQFFCLLTKGSCLGKEWRSSTRIPTTTRPGDDGWFQVQWRGPGHWINTLEPMNKQIHTYIHYITLHHITSHYITSHHITSHHHTCMHACMHASHRIASHRITSHHITSHHITYINQTLIKRYII